MSDAERDATQDLCAPPWHDKPQGGQGAERPDDPTQHAAQLAREHVPAAIEAAARMLGGKVPRNARYTLEAAKLILEVSGNLKPSPVAVGSPELRLVDAQAAAAELKRRKAQR